jgi:hypothetical protein
MSNWSTKASMTRTGIIRSDVIIGTTGQQANLTPVRAFDESLHGVGSHS